MRTKPSKINDISGAATELGYIFTFLLGVMLLSVFSVFGLGILKLQLETDGTKNLLK